MQVLIPIVIILLLTCPDTAIALLSPAIAPVSMPRKYL